MMDQKKYNEWLIEEVAKSPALLQDKLWRMNHLYWITTKDGQKKVFELNRAQEHFLVNYLLPPHEYFRHIILKSRQLGFTTLLNLYILDEILFNPNKAGMVIAHKVQDAKEMFVNKVDFALRNFCKDIQDALFKIVRNSTKKVQVNFSEVLGEGSSSHISVDISGQGATLHYLHVTEFAAMCVLFPDRANSLEQRTFPAVPFDGKVFIESTAEGMSGRFYELFMDSWNVREKITPTMSRVKFLPHFYNWQWDDMELKKITETVPVEGMEVCEVDWGEYQREHNLTDVEITYYYMKWNQMGKDVHKLREQYPTTAEEAFVSTGVTFFPTTKVVSELSRVVKGDIGELIKDGQTGVVEFREASGGSLEVFEMPEKGTNYVIGGDTAEGLAHGDAQVGYVINAKTEKCVAVYKSQVPPDEYAVDMFNLGKWYNWALLAVEVNKDGLWVNDALDKMGYVNLYFRKVFDDVTKAVQKYFGWKTTSATRPFMLTSLRSAYLRLHDAFPKVFLEEALTFIRNQKGRPEAMNGKHDDVIMASAIAYTVLQESGVQKVEKKDEDKSLIGFMFGEWT